MPADTFPHDDSVADAIAGRCTAVPRRRDNRDRILTEWSKRYESKAEPEFMVLPVSGSL